MRYELTEGEWGVIKPMLPNKPRGVPRVDDRRTLNGIYWVLRSGAPWRDLPRQWQVASPFLKDRCEGLLDEARPGRPRTIDDDQVAAVIERTLRTTPVDVTHWSIRSMAAETGFSHTTIRWMWAAFGLQPHRSQTFKLSNDPLFVDKVRDIIGLSFPRPTEPRPQRR